MSVMFVPISLQCIEFSSVKRVQSWDKPSKCDECAYNTTQSVNIMTYKPGTFTRETFHV